MGFAQYLIDFLSQNRVFEATSAPANKTDFAKNEIEAKVGGDPSDKDALQSSFEAIEQSLDSITFEYFEKPDNPGLKEIFALLSSRDRIDFFEKYTKKEEQSALELAKKLISIDIEKEPREYNKHSNLYSIIADRLQKINVFVSSQLGEKITESADDETKKKLDEILRSSRNGLMSFKNVIEKEQKKIDSLPEDAEGVNRLESLMELLKMLGMSEVLRKKIESKQGKMPKDREKEAEERGTISGKNRIIRGLINAIKLAELPQINEERIEREGDYFKQFNALKDSNITSIQQSAAWMEDILEKYVFGGPTAQLSEFKLKAEKTESPLEENQLAYLKANRYWILRYIDSEIGPEGKRTILSDKDREKFKADLNSVCLEKEKEIKNYYVSRDFSLGNFGGLQIKPEIRLPLYTKVNLPVSEEDRKKESPLRNVMKGAWSVVGGVFGGVPTTINYETVKQGKRARAAIFNGLNSIIRGGVTLVGGKQAGRDYAEATGKFAKKIGIEDEGASSGKKVKEDMLSVTDSPGFIAVNPEAPGQIMQTPASIAGGMDTFALAGPQRKIKSGKKKKSKKKETTPSQSQTRVASFADFMQRK